MLRLGVVRHAIIVAPHPDDEAIAAAVLIEHLRRRGARVTIAVASNGAASHRYSVSWPRTRLVMERQRETRRAMRRLGVPATDIIFLNLQDGQLMADRASCVNAIRTVIARHKRCDLIVGPSLDDEHPDHRAVAFAIAASRSPARRLYYRVWPPKRTLSPVHSALRVRPGFAKASVIAEYRTQYTRLVDDPHGFAMSVRERAAFSRPIEYFSEQAS